MVQFLLLIIIGGKGKETSLLEQVRSGTVTTGPRGQDVGESTQDDVTFTPFPLNETSKILFGFQTCSPISFPRLDWCS